MVGLLLGLRWPHFGGALTLLVLLPYCVGLAMLTGGLPNSLLARAIPAVLDSIVTGGKWEPAGSGSL